MPGTLGVDKAWGDAEGFEAGQKKCSKRCFKTLTHSDGPGFKLVRRLLGSPLNVSPTLFLPLHCR